MKCSNHTMLAAAFLLAAPGIAVAQGTGAGTAAPQGGQAPIGMQAAIEAARAQFDGGVLDAELERDRGRLVYEIDLVRDGAVHQAIVDAQSGDVVSVTEQTLTGTWRRWFDADRLQAAEAAGGVLIDALPQIEQTMGGQVTDASLDEENGTLVYEIDADTPQGEREAKIDATTGQVVPGSMDD